MDSHLFSKLLNGVKVEHFNQIDLHKAASLSPPLFSVFLLKCVENLQRALKVDRFGELYFNELEKIVMKNLFYSDVIFSQHRIHIKGSLVNEFRKVCSEIYIKYSEDSSFEQAVAEAKPNAYFRLYSFTYKPFKLVVSPVILNLDKMEDKSDDK